MLIILSLACFELFFCVLKYIDAYWILNLVISIAQGKHRLYISSCYPYMMHFIFDIHELYNCWAVYLWLPINAIFRAAIIGLHDGNHGIASITRYVWLICCCNWYRQCSRAVAIDFDIAYHHNWSIPLPIVTSPVIWYIHSMHCYSHIDLQCYA